MLQESCMYECALFHDPSKGNCMVCRKKNTGKEKIKLLVIESKMCRWGKPRWGERDLKKKNTEEFRKKRMLLGK